MYHLASIFPVVRRSPIRLSRDSLMLLMLALNQLLLGVETYTAHIISGTIVPYEWIPILFGPIAGLTLLAAGAISLHRRSTAVAIGNLVFITSITIGLLGAYFHLNRALLPYAPAGEQFKLSLIIWAPPLIAPLTFCLIGVLGISMLWIENPADSGILMLWRGKKIHMPLSKSRACFFIISMGCLSTVISSVVDHARTGFTNPWLWLPTIVGIFTTVVAFTLGLFDRPTQADLTVYIGAMLLMVITGMLGSWLHYQFDLTSKGTVVIERFIRGAPLMAPMLFADMGALGLIVLFDPE